MISKRRSILLWRVACASFLLLGLVIIGAMFLQRATHEPDLMSLRPNTQSNIVTTSFSSFHCQGGSQSFDGWRLQHTAGSFPSANDASIRVCMLRNVCWHNDTLWFYENQRNPLPSRARMTAFNSNLVHPGYLSGGWAPTVVFEARPIYYEYVNNQTFFLSFRSFDDNFAHLMIDVLLPVFTAATVFDVPMSQAQLLNFGCRRYSGAFSSIWQPNSTNPLNGRLRAQDCQDNYRKYAPIVLGRPAVDLQDDWSHRSVCMDKLIVGQSRAYGLASLDLQRSVTLRTAQKAIAKNVGIDLQKEARLQTHSILVLLKVPAWTKPMWLSLCDDVKAATLNVSSNTPVTCIDPVPMAVEAQVHAARKASVIIAEHGTVSYGALYSREGASLICIGSDKELKDPQVFLFGAHLNTYYMVAEEKKDLSMYIQLALAAAAQQLGLNTM
jgi:hypothetical protein